MSKLLAAILLLLSFGSANAQEEEEKKILTGNVISATGFAWGNLTNSSLEKFDTRWLQLPGYGWSTGAGFNLTINDSWSMDADFGLSGNTYIYDRTTLRLNLSYTVPYVDFKIAKFFNRRNSNDRFWYVKAGASYSFMKGQSKEEDEIGYSYKLQLAETGVIGIMPEIGLHNKLGGNNSIQFGIVGQYALNTILTSTLSATTELNSAIANKTGSFIGFSVKYFYGFKSFGGGSGSSGGKDPVIRDGI
jgi:hypothetical protein